MIDVQEILRAAPHFDSFCSVATLRQFVEELRIDPRFEVSVAGASAGGEPIYHVRFGAGAVKALFVAFPDCMEPIGGMTVFSLMKLLRDGNRALLDAEVEWHIVPCIDPDGALQNEAWTQQPFTFSSFMRNYYVQARRDQVDNSFPVAHKKLLWNDPSREARILKELMDRIRPDFFFSLHNAWTGGAFYLISRDIGRKYYEDIYRLLEQERLPLQKRPLWKEVCPELAPGVVEMYSISKYYDYLEKSGAQPERVLTFGAASWDYLATINPNAISLIAEVGYALHPDDGSQTATGCNLRQFKLRIDADSKYLAAAILEQWEKVKEDLDKAHPIYQAVVSGRVFPPKDKLCDAPMPLSRYPTRDVLFNPEYDRPMTEADRFNACMTDGGFFFLLFSYQFVRLLRASKQTAAVLKAIERLERLFTEAEAELSRQVNFDDFRVVEYDTLARVQLGSGLIALNSLLGAAAR